MKFLFFANTDWYLYNFRLSLIQALREQGHELVLVSPSGPYGEKLLAMGYRWMAAPMERRSLNPVKEAALLFWLWRLIRREKPDVVHSFTIKCAVYGGIAARLAGAARVNAVAGMGYVFINNALRARVLRPLVRFLLRAALTGDRAFLILQNTEDAALFESARIASRDTIRVIPGSGVDCAKFLPPDDRTRSERPFRVVLAARMLWDKGIREFVEASRILQAEGRAVEFVLAGTPDPGNPAAIPEAVLNDWVQSGAVVWLGHVEDMPKLFAGADVVTLPSYREGLPKSLIEAAACARPIVTTDAPGCREAVEDGVNGFCVPVKQAAPLAAAIARLQDDPGLAKKLGQAARMKALAEFDQSVVIARTIAVYEEVH